MNITAPRPLKRLLFAFSIITVFTILSLLLEPRRRSLSCRNSWACLNPFSHKDYQILTVPEEQQVAVIEVTLADGVVKFNRKLKPEVPSVLFLVLTRDGKSWSRDFQSTRRSVYDFLDLLASTNLMPQNISLGFLTESKAEFDLLKQATDEIPLGRVTILLKDRENHANVGGSDADEGERRKKEMARQRNYLMNRVLLDERHIIWVDAGVVELSPGIIQRMIDHGDSRDDVGIITARCEQDKSVNYDTSAWAISEQSTLLNPAGVFDQADHKFMFEQLEKSRKLVPELIRKTVDSSLLPLHSVGGTILYVRADLVRQGLIFPWWKTVGTSWGDEGWIGLDTEGLCYLSSRMQGGGCFVLGGMSKVRHTDFG